MHGVVWEWVNDFGDAVASCGATGSGAPDATDFPAFERAALRTSLAARFVVKSLGFRCAADGGAP
jgi:formylglycine-generating enzyme required for sulfatase activity